MFVLYTYVDLHNYPCWLIWFGCFKYILLLDNLPASRHSRKFNNYYRELRYLYAPYTRLRLQKSHGDFVYGNYELRISHRRNNQSHLLLRLMQIGLHSQLYKFCSVVVFSCRLNIIAVLNPELHHS